MQALAAVGTGASPEAAEPLAGTAPALGFLQVAFAGHNRAEDLGQQAAAERQLEAAFDLLRAAGVTDARLLTGLAEGADRLAVATWQRAGLGPVHAVLPFLEPAHKAEPGIGSATFLDGAAARHAGRNPHLDQARWVVGAADLLVVTWTGRQARGAGGTADAVRLALEAGAPILWLQPKEAEPRLIRPEHLDEDFGFLEVLEALKAPRPPLVETATPENLRAALAAVASPEDETEAADPPAARVFSSNIPFIWRTYAGFRRLFGGAPSPAAPVVPPADLAEQPGFGRLSVAYEAADRQARQLGAVHRSHQVILLALAILAAIAGSSSALWPQLKPALVITELLLALVALGIWLDSERGKRHHRWGDARRVAEALRMERVAWALGLHTGPAATGRPTAHSVRRRAGLPLGAYDAARVAAWGRWAIEEAVAGQAAYHRDQARINHHISHNVHRLENASFGVLLLVMTAYLAAVAAERWAGLSVPHWVGGLVVVAGAIAPAMAAAGLALEATLGLEDQAGRSRLLDGELESLARTVDPASGLERYRAIVKAAFRLERAQEERWVGDAERRRLFRGG